MSNRKYLRLADGYHERSPYNQYQSSGKYSTKQPNVVSDNRSERSSNINGGAGSRNNSPRSQHSNLSPRSHRIKSSYSKTKELSKRGSSSSPVDAVSHHSHSSSVSDQTLKVDSISTDESFPWSQHTSSSGKTYYYNCKTEKSQWEKPKEWLEREYRFAREKKKREAKEKNEYCRNNLHPNQASRGKTTSSRESNRDCSSSTKQDCQGGGSAESKYEGNFPRERPLHHRDEIKRSLQHGQTNYQPNSHIVKTTSANTSAVSTAMHRPDQLSARESAVSPSNSLQDISPPVTPITVPMQNNSPCITVSPVITTHSPVLLVHQQSPNLQNKSPVQPNPPRHLTIHHGNSSTPPPPPPPLTPHTSSVPAPPGGTMQAHCTEGSFPNSLLMNDVGGFARLTAEDGSFNGINVLSQTQLHPLQQATLLQAQFHSSSNVQPMASGLLTSSPPAPPKPHFQPIKQSTSAPGSPLSFSTRSYPGNSLSVHSAASPKTSSLVYPSPQIVNIQEFAAHFNRGLISHTLGWPSESLEKQAQRLSDDTLGLCFTNNRLKADLIPLNYHQNLTGMRMAVGAKRIEFLREQTRKLETSDSIS